MTEKIKFKNDGERALVEDFKQRCRYLSGGYDDRVAFEKLREAMVEAERAMAVGTGQQGDDAKLYRIFYLALPPDMFLPVAKMISTVLYDEGDVVHRVIVEKPFGRDLQTSNELAHDLGALFRESEVVLSGVHLGTLRFT